MEENEEMETLLESSLAPEEEVTPAQIADRIEMMVDTDDRVALDDEIQEFNSVDIAEALNLLSAERAAKFFSLISDVKLSAEIFPYLRVVMKEALIDKLGERKLSALLTYVSNDDIVDTLEDLPRAYRNRLFDLLPNKRRQVIKKLADFSDDTIGSIMTTEYLSIDSRSTVQDVFDKIRRVGDRMDTVREIFVVDETNKLLGVEPLEDMMFEKPEETIDDVMSTDYACILPTADRSEAIPICKKYDLPVLPVVSRSGEMLGIITFDDVMDVIEEENTEDLYKGAAISPSSTPYLETKTFRLARSYVIWLIILLVINTFAGIIISRFENALLTLPILTCFIPALNDSCGDAGDQSSSMVIRALGTGELSKKDYLRVAMKEFVAGFITALIVAVFAFGWVMLEMNANLINTDGAFTDDFIEQAGGIYNAQMIIAGIVAIAFLFGITVAKLLGALLPLLAKACHIDPAVMSGPLISSIMDILTLLVYFAVAMLLIDSIMPGEIILTAIA